jgi:hypothetical protein
MIADIRHHRSIRQKGLEAAVDLMPRSSPFHESGVIGTQSEST